jgi:peptidoglycan/xylan/chitin deacetylase (PgdA/CDA1 family)
MFTPLETKSGPPLDKMFLTGPKRKILVSIFFVIFLSIFLAVNFIRQQYVAPIIMYHMIDTKINPYVQRLIVFPRAFERQMLFLKEHHYNVVPLETLASLIRDKKKIPPKTIAITFDDGNKDNYTNAFPILKKYELPATMFIIVDEVARPQGDRLSWDEIKVMRDSGLITFGGHSLGPEPLVNIKSDAELKRQIFASKVALGEKLGREVNIFSYPEGKFNSKIRQLVIDAGYKIAVAANPGKKFPSDDIFALKRLRISSSSDNLFVFWIETSGFYNFIRERRHK